MPRYLCNRCDDDWSDDVDGYCTSCREDIAEIEAQQEEEHNSMRDEPTDAEIDRSQALIAAILGIKP